METILPMINPALSLPVRLRAFSELTGKGVTIVIIDSGFIPHPDLTQPNNRIIAYYDAVHDIEDDMPPTEIEISSWHGTMTACTAAGNGYLSSGHYRSLAPKANIVLIRTMHQSSIISTQAIVQALRWCYRNSEQYGIKIINLSVYADEIDHSVHHPVIAEVERLVQSGITVVAASGNNFNAPLRPPASAPSAITVGGLDDKNNVTRKDDALYQTTFGKTMFNNIKPEIIAPAIWLAAPILPQTSVHKEAAALCAMDAMTDDMLLRTFPLLIADTLLPLQLIKTHSAITLRKNIRERMEAESIISPYYKFVDGTSFAAPIVCSLIAQMLESRPTLSPQEVKTILTETAVLLDNYPKEPQGYGVINVEHALRRVQALNESDGLKRL